MKAAWHVIGGGEGGVFKNKGFVWVGLGFGRWAYMEGDGFEREKAYGMRKYSKYICVIFLNIEAVYQAGYMNARGHHFWFI